MHYFLSCLYSYKILYIIIVSLLSIDFVKRVKKYDPLCGDEYK